MVQQDMRPCIKIYINDQMASLLLGGKIDVLYRRFYNENTINLLT